MYVECNKEVETNQTMTPLFLNVSISQSLWSCGQSV